MPHSFWRSLVLRQHAGASVIPHGGSSPCTPRGPDLGLPPLPLAVDDAAQTALLEEFSGDEYQRLFEALRGDRRINPGLSRAPQPDPDLIHNGYFPTPDAEIYAAMILRFRPTTIIEVGGGFSTVVARSAIAWAGMSTRLCVIDPQPRRDVEDVADEVERIRVEHSSLRPESIDEGTLLFIDSSHLTVPGGDGPFLYCRLLPHLPPNVLVHVHDIFLPDEYPDVYAKQGYSEQYLLAALLANSRRFRVVLAVHDLVRRHPAAARSALGPKVGTGLFGGASLWMRSLTDPADIS